MSDGRIRGVVRCAHCDTIEKRWVRTSALSVLDDIAMGEPCGIEDSDFDLTIRRRSPDEPLKFLESFTCSGCGRSWVLVTVADNRIISMTGVHLADGLELANYCSENVGEEFEEATGERLWNGSDFRSDWLDLLRRMLPRRFPALERGLPRFALEDGKPSPPDGPDAALAEILASIVSRSDADDFGRPGATFPLPDPLVATSIAHTSAIPEDVSAHLRSDEDSDTWMVGKRRQRQHAWPIWRLTRGADLRSLARQALLLAGVTPRLTDDPDDYPCGASVTEDGWVLVSRLRGTADRGVYVAMNRECRRAIATLTSAQKTTLDEVRSRFDVELAEISELVAIDVVNGVPGDHVAMLEVEPSGVPLSYFRLPLRTDEVCSIGRGLFQRLAAAAARGLAIEGIRPETLYVAHVEAPRWWLPQVTGIVPRGEAFMAGRAPRSTGSVTPYTWHYQAPEVLKLELATPASDVFSACAVLAHLATGEHPFDGNGVTGQLTAVLGGHRRPFRGPSAIARIVDRGLMADPAQRPSAAELQAALEAVD